MALIAGVVLFLAGVLGTAFSQQLADEFKAWIPWVVRRVIQRALAQLPEDQRERFQEEWRSHVDEVPGEIGKLYVALGCLFAARKMASILVADVEQSAVTELFTRTFDLAFSAACLFALAPLLCGSALWMWLANSGRVLGTDLRVGLNGQTFRRYRFRREGTLGKLLWASSMCELPMLVNILRGDMAIIGPLPDRVSSVDKIYESFPEYRTRTKVRPGVTSWAAVNRPRTLEDELVLDLFYIENRSLRLNLLILWRTLRLGFADLTTKRE